MTVPLFFMWLNIAFCPVCVYFMHTKRRDLGWFFFGLQLACLACQVVMGGK